jgi:hypothetical protein
MLPKGVAIVSHQLVDNVGKKSLIWALVATDLQDVRGLGELSKIRDLLNYATVAGVVREAFMAGNYCFRRQEGEFCILSPASGQYYTYPASRQFFS